MAARINISLRIKEIVSADLRYISSHIKRSPCYASYAIWAKIRSGQHGSRIHPGVGYKIHRSSVLFITPVGAKGILGTPIRSWTSRRAISFRKIHKIRKRCSALTSEGISIVWEGAAFT